MSQLTMSTIPGFSDLADSAIAGGQPLTDNSILAISHNAKFGAVRSEVIFMGFYTTGNTVPTPTSPVDGYAYGQAEISYCWMVYSDRAPAAGFTPGQSSPPPLSNNSPYANSVLDAPYQADINDATGLVTFQVQDRTAGVINCGTLKVYSVCQRASVNVSD